MAYRVSAAPPKQVLENKWQVTEDQKDGSSQKIFERLIARANPSPIGGGRQREQSSFWPFAPSDLLLHLQTSAGLYRVVIGTRNGDISLNSTPIRIHVTKRHWRS